MIRDARIGAAARGAGSATVATVPREPVPWLALAAAVAVLTALQFATPTLIGIDAYFHVRYAAVIREAGVRGFPPPFPWLPLTILSPDRYADHHMLYHLLLTPFTLGDLRVGGKLAGLAGAAAFVAAFLWVLRREAVPWQALALLALFASSADLLYRLSMTRVQGVSLVCLLVGFHLALRHRHGALAALACVYAWLYDGFPLLLVPVGATFLAEIVLERRLRPGILVAALAGMAVGVIVNPYFPEYLRFIVHHFGDKLLPGETIRIGSEWLPYTPLGIVGNVLTATVFTACGVAAAGGLPRQRRTLAALVVALVFLALTLRAKRFIEYFAPSATLFAAFACGDSLRRLSAAWRRIVVLALAVIALANVVGVGVTLRRKALESPHGRYAPFAEYVARSAPPGAMLCTTDWDDFPWLYFHDVASTYLVGLDPTYFRDRHRDAYWRWVEITQGRVEHPGHELATRFPCAYVLTDRLHAAFLSRVADDPDLEEVLSDDQGVLYRVKRDGPPPVYPTTLP